MKTNKKKIQSEQSRKQIIEATMRLLAEKGYGKTSISDISKATGLTKGALYYHYENKEEIFQSTVAHIGNIFRQKLIEAEVAGNALKRLEYLFNAFIDIYEENNHYILILSSLVLEMESGNASFAQPLVEVLMDLAPFIEKIIAKGQSNGEINHDGDAKLLSLNIIGMLVGNTIPWMLNKDRTNYRVIMESQKTNMIKSAQN